jgi:hypothetical protein
MPASVELVKIAVKAYGDGFCEVALGLADPLIRWDERASRPDGELVWNHDDVQRAMRRYLDSWQEYFFDLEDVAEVAPGKVVGICREWGVDSEGITVDRRFGGLWVIEEGKIASWSTYLTPKEAVRAAKELGGTSQRFRQPSAAAAGRKAPEEGSERPTPAPLDEQKRKAAKARAKLQRQKTAP